MLLKYKSKKHLPDGCR